MYLFPAAEVHHLPAEYKMCVRSPTYTISPCRCIYFPPPKYIIFPLNTKRVYARRRIRLLLANVSISRRRSTSSSCRIQNVCTLADVYDFYLPMYLFPAAEVHHLPAEYKTYVRSPMDLPSRRHAKHPLAERRWYQLDLLLVLNRRAELANGLGDWQRDIKALGQFAEYDFVASLGCCDLRQSHSIAII